MMMLLKRVAWITGILLLGLSVAGGAQAEKFSLIGGGAQFHIGTGLALPIQAAVQQPTNPTEFPPLLVGILPGQVVDGTIARPLVSASGKAAYQRRLHVPAGALSNPANLTTVGVRDTNPTLYAVATNLQFVWPASGAEFDIKPGGPSTTVVGPGGASLFYNNVLGQRFGGPAPGLILEGSPSGLIASRPVTLFLDIDGTAVTAPCIHTALPGGTNPGCIAGLLAAVTKLGQPQAIGNANGVSVTTRGAKFFGNNIAIMNLGATPKGTVNLAVPVAFNPGIPATNMATSIAGSWTSGQLVVTNNGALGDTETFTLSGKDSRTANGGGTIQMVSGSVSARTVSGPNANRGWVALELSPAIAGTPALSPLAQGAAAGLMLLAGGYIARRKLVRS